MVNTTDYEVNAKILNLCESDPDAGLKFIEQTIKKKPDAESNPFGKFVKAMAYGSKGLFQLARSKPELDFTGFDEEELRDDLGIADIHLDYLEKGLQEIKEMEKIYPGALKMFGTKEDRMGELKVDGMAMVLGRCRPGRVQQILGKTKFCYFGINRIKDAILNLTDEAILPPGELRPFLQIPFSFPSIVKSVLLLQIGKDTQGRRYIECWLFEKTFDDFGPDETFGDTKVGIIYLFDDGTFAHTLQEERKAEEKEPQQKKQLKKKGFFEKLFG